MGTSTTTACWKVGSSISAGENPAYLRRKIMEDILSYFETDESSESYGNYVAW
jgi:hypothetical protein